MCYNVTKRGWAHERKAETLPDHRGEIPVQPPVCAVLRHRLADHQRLVLPAVRHRHVLGYRLDDRGLQRLFSVPVAAHFPGKAGDLRHRHRPDEMALPQGRKNPGHPP